MVMKTKKATLIWVAFFVFKGEVLLNPSAA